MPPFYKTINSFFYIQILLLFAFGLSELKADLPYMPITFKLSTNKKIYQVGECIQFKITIINSDPNRSYPIVIPGSQNKGSKLITLNAFSVNIKTNFYTNVAKEDNVIKMKCNQPGSVSVCNLGPHDSTVVYFFLNDKKNYLTQTASHHQLVPELKEGKYQMLIYYNPKGTELESLYHYIGTTNDSTSTVKLNFWWGGNVSNYWPIEIVSDLNKATGSIENTCNENCSFCNHIHNQNWKKVENYLANIFSSVGVFKDTSSRVFALSNHRNVVSLSPPPEAILDILPSYYSREIIFNSQDELYYFKLQFQVGIVYRTRTRIKGFIHLFWRRFKWIHTEDLKYHELVGLNEMFC
jgi:hypothetical protein